MDYYRALSHNSVAVANDEAEPEVKAEPEAEVKESRSAKDFNTTVPL